MDEEPRLGECSPYAIIRTRMHKGGGLGLTTWTVANGVPNLGLASNFRGSGNVDGD